jgi:hypothetical protein
MTAVGRVVKTLSVEIAHDGGAAAEFNTAVLAVRETPNRNTQTTTVASGESSTDVGPTSWTIDIDYNVSWAANSLHRILLENDGETGTIVWQPDPVGSPTVGRSATVVLVAPPTDATVGNFQTGTVSLPVQGAITTVTV